MARLFYDIFAKRSSVFTATICVSAFIFERVYDHLCESFFEHYNKGRLWMHIKGNYGPGSHSPLEEKK